MKSRLSAPLGLILSVLLPLIVCFLSSNHALAEIRDCTDNLKFTFVENEHFLTREEVLGYFREGRYGFKHNMPTDFLKVDGDKLTLEFPEEQLIGHALGASKENPAYLIMIDQPLEDNTFRRIKVRFFKNTNQIKIIEVSEATSLDYDSYQRGNNHLNTQLIGEGYDEYDIRALNGVKVLRISHIVQDKVENRHGVDIYDVVEPMFKGRYLSPLNPAIQHGMTISNRYQIRVQTESGERVNVILRKIQDQGEWVFNLTTAYPL